MRLVGQCQLKDSCEASGQGGGMTPPRSRRFQGGGVHLLFPVTHTIYSVDVCAWLPDSQLKLAQRMEPAVPEGAEACGTVYTTEGGQHVALPHANLVAG